MSLSDISNRDAIVAAMDEFDRLGREGFLNRYGFGPSRSYHLVHNGRRYDSKAIVGVAHGIARPDLGPLQSNEFTGGNASVKQLLERLGFAVEFENGGNSAAALTSTRLVREQVYTRDELRNLFAIKDATLNTGVFRPKGTSSVWLFITEEKTADRTQYRDRLVDETLHWQGQTAGRTDALLIEHKARGLELLVFFRKRKYEHPGAGFRYLGEFQYSSHSGSAPTSFVLQRLSLAALIPADEADEDSFDPSSIQDARQRISRMIAQRRGQRRFRDALIAAYGGRCAISGCAILDVLEAAHIHPYRGPETNKVSNGLLLRTDIHTLFDCGLIAIDEEKMRVIVAPRLRDTEYGSFHNKEILPSVGRTASKEALAKHRRSHR